MNTAQILKAAGAALAIAFAGQALQSRPVDWDPAGGATSCPEVIVHRTGMGTRPENTTVGIQWAATTGAAAVEMDVRWTASGFPVLMHDATVDRTTNGTGAVASLGLAQITALNAADYAPYQTAAYVGVRVPYGYQFMKAAHDGGISVLLDIQGTPTGTEMDRLAYYVNMFGWGSRTRFQANAGAVRAMHARYPAFTYVVIEGYSTLGAMNTAGQIRSGAYVRSQGAGAYSILASAIAPAAVQYWHDSGLRVNTWTSDNSTTDTAANWTRVMGAGVDAIITNHAPDVLALETSNGC